MKEIYGLGYLLRVKKPFIEVKSEIGDYLLNPTDPIVLSGVGIVSIRALNLIKKHDGSIAFRKGFRVQYMNHPNATSGKLLVNQLLIYDDLEKSLEIARAIVNASTLNKLAILEILHAQGTSMEEQIHSIRELMDLQPVSVSDLRQIEARITKQYFEGLRKVIDPKYKFEARTRRPPRDYFSAALSYANTILYRYVEVAVRSVGLEPRIGYLHEPFRKRPSLALDLAEQFRQPIVDSALLPAFIGKSMRLKIDFSKKGDAVYLSNTGRKRVTMLLRKKLGLKIGGIEMLKHIWIKTEEFAQYILGLKKKFEPFTVYKYPQS